MISKTKAFQGFAPLDDRDLDIVAGGWGPSILATVVGSDASGQKTALGGAAQGALQGALMDAHASVAAPGGFDAAAMLGLHVDTGSSLADLAQQHTDPAATSGVEAAHDAVQDVLHDAHTDAVATDPTSAVPGGAYAAIVGGLGAGFGANAATAASDGKGDGDGSGEHHHHHHHDHDHDDD